jgi:hypothetical protein
MVDWKLYIDSPLTKSLDLCLGSLDEGGGGGDGWGDSWGGDGWSGDGYGDWNDVVGDGMGYGYSYGYNDGDGRSADKW